MPYQTKVSQIIIISLLIFCVSCTGVTGDKPAEAAKEWYVAVNTMEALKADSLVCKAKQDEFRNNMNSGSVFVSGAELLSGNVKIELDASKVSFKTISKKGNEATVQAKGEMRGAVAGIVKSQEVDERWLMLQEDGEWKWCGYPAEGAVDKPTSQPNNPPTVSGPKGQALVATFIGQDGQSFAGQQCAKGNAPDNIHIHLDGLRTDVQVKSYTVQEPSGGGVWANPCDPVSNWSLHVIPGTSGQADLYFKPFRNAPDGTPYIVYVQYNDSSSVSASLPGGNVQLSPTGPPVSGIEGEALVATFIGQDGQSFAGQQCTKGNAPDNIHIHLDGLRTDVQVKSYTVQEPSGGGVWANPCDPVSNWSLHVIPGTSGQADLYFKPFRNAPDGTPYIVYVQYNDSSSVSASLPGGSVQLSPTGPIDSESHPIKFFPTEINNPADGMVMIYIPAGEFLMGSTDDDSQADGNEKPQHTVYLDGYWIDRTEVTNAMFSKFLQATSYDYGGSIPDGKDDHPVVQVSWIDAAAYCEWAGGSLPTEAQWEKAARGTDGRIYPWGDQAASCDYAVMYDGGNGCEKDDIWPVGSKPAGASPYGLLDMAGNVWEWVLDWYQDSFYQDSPERNPEGPSSGDDRVLRGGSWVNESRLVRAAFRLKLNPTNRGASWGFRCSR